MNKLNKKSGPKSEARICIAVLELQNGQAAHVTASSDNNIETKAFIML